MTVLIPNQRTEFFQAARYILEGFTPHPVFAFWAWFALLGYLLVEGFVYLSLKLLLLQTRQLHLDLDRTTFPFANSGKSEQNNFKLHYFLIIIITLDKNQN